MRLVLKRLYLNEEETIGGMQVFFSGNYISQHIDISETKPSPKRRGRWMFLCDTLEKRAIPWEDNSMLGYRKGKYKEGWTAIPEGVYPLTIEYSPKLRRDLVAVKDIPEIGSVVIRSNSNPLCVGSDIIVGNLVRREHQEWYERRLLKSLSTSKLLINLVKEAQEHGEEVLLEIRSPKGWTYER